jgi:hypothetical protein
MNKNEAIQIAIEALENILEMKKAIKNKLEFINEQEYEKAAEQRDIEKKCLDNLPNLNDLEEIIKIAKS